MTEPFIVILTYRVQARDRGDWWIRVRRWFGGRR
jgi:hypothetical protein